MALRYCSAIDDDYYCATLYTVKWVWEKSPRRSLYEDKEKGMTPAGVIPFEFAVRSVTCGPRGRESQ